MFGKRCQLCGGKLNGSICQECGLDNSKMIHSMKNIWGPANVMKAL